MFVPIPSFPTYSNRGVCLVLMFFFFKLGGSFWSFVLVVRVCVCVVLLFVDFVAFVVIGISVILHSLLLLFFSSFFPSPLSVFSYSFLSLDLSLSLSLSSLSAAAAAAAAHQPTKLVVSDNLVDHLLGVATSIHVVSVLLSPVGEDAELGHGGLGVPAVEDSLGEPRDNHDVLISVRGEVLAGRGEGANSAEHGGGSNRLEDRHLAVAGVLRNSSGENGVLRRGEYVR